MLTHPTLDQMHQLGLAGMARAFAGCRPIRKAPISRMPNGSACCSTVKPPIATRGDCGRGCVMLGGATRPPSRTSITVPHGVSTAHYSSR